MQALGLCEVIPACISLGTATGSYVAGSYVAESLLTVITAAALAAPSFRRI